jgi:hypothetical protein
VKTTQLAAAFLAGAASLVSVFAQAGAPQNSSTAAIPRLADGTPNLSGIWQVMNSANFDIQDHIAQKDVPAGLGVVDGNEIPYQPWALAKKKENFQKRDSEDPEAKCYLLGVPRINYWGHPFQIFQGTASDKITFLYEYSYANRYIYTNGTKHPKGPIEWWMGDSRGHWEGDTLVVDVIHFNDETWFDRVGDFHSEELHVVERYALTDPDHINYQVTIEDPKVFTKPWSMSMILYRHKEKSAQLLEYVCSGFNVEKHYPAGGSE